jgi:two-component system chemotaxis sensor kinase CheA
MRQRTIKPYSGCDDFTDNNARHETRLRKRPMSDTDDLVKEFLAESTENLDRLDQDFVAMEKDPSAKDRIGSIFRTIHTIKGTCGFLGFGKLESVTHVGENLLSRLRDGAMTIDTEITSALLAMVDAVRDMLRSIQASGQDGDADYSALIQRLTSIIDHGRAPAATTPSAAETPTVEEADNEGEHGAPSPASLEHDEKIAATLAMVAPDKAREPEAHGTGLGGIRVDVSLLDKLMNLVGELVLARNQILQFSATQEDVALIGPTQRLNLITTELQEGVMKTRMQPIGNVWGKFPRIVRDVAQSCGKSVRVEMEGRETELDKTIIESIKDPLTHIIRNSVDHGIETPEKRIAAGKPAEGRLFLRAFHEGGQVNIEIVDDGAGINVERVKAKAIEKGLITPDQASRMSKREAINLIFLPGFSTAEKITNVSGRGVGMDVVKTNIEKIGGIVDVQTKLGEGTTLRIKIPLTLAIIPALIVSTGGDRFAIPQVSLLELVRLESEQATKAIEMIHGAPVYRLRGHLLPLVYLDKELRTNSAAAAGGAINIVVLQADERHFGLVVDEINDTEEIVVKPLSKHLKGLSTFAGATIMGDGRVALILDVMGVAQKAAIVSGSRDRGVHDTSGSGKGDQQQKQTLLLFRAAGDRRMAIPLSTVARLEEFNRSVIETAGGRDVVQYRGQIMPLISLSEIISGRAVPAASADAIQVVVYSNHDRSYGLVVDRILDIVEEIVVVQRLRARRGVLGSAVIQEKVTELLDLDGVIRLVESESDVPSETTPLAA